VAPTARCYQLCEAWGREARTIEGGAPPDAERRRLDRLSGNVLRYLEDTTGASVGLAGFYFVTDSPAAANENGSAASGARSR